MVSVPLFTNVVLQGSALAGGLNLMRLTLGLPLGAVAGGYLTVRIGPAVAGAVGLALAGAGFAAMTTWTTDPGPVALTLPLLVAGCGFGLVIAPVNAAVLEGAAERDHATVASLLTVVRLLGALVGVALLTSRGLGGFYSEAGLIPLDDPRFIDRVAGLELRTFHQIFGVAAAVCFATLLPALRLGKAHGERLGEAGRGGS
jgi:MFS family permease